MTKTVECFYVLSSPWAYFGGPRLQEIARRHGARLVLRPYEWLVVTAQTGGISLRTRPQPRQAYHAVELDRWRRHLGMPLNLAPRFYPTDNRAAARMVIAAQQRGLDAMRLSHAILRALWAEDRDIRDAAVRRAVADETASTAPPWSRPRTTPRSSPRSTPTRPRRSPPACSARRPTCSTVSCSGARTGWSSSTAR
jgi:2-hydroxychromene-2-carboxylate isomerase